MLKGNACAGLHGYHYPRRSVTAHPEMGYRFVAPVSRCADNPKVVGRSATLPVFSNLDLAEGTGRISSRNHGPWFWTQASLFTQGQE